MRSVVDRNVVVHDCIVATCFRWSNIQIQKVLCDVTICRLVNSNPRRVFELYRHCMWRQHVFPKRR